jgi:hypothetical protein
MDRRPFSVEALPFHEIIPFYGSALIALSHYFTQAIRRDASGF